MKVYVVVRDGESRPACSHDSLDEAMEVHPAPQGWVSMHDARHPTGWWDRATGLTVYEVERCPDA